MRKINLAISLMLMWLLIGAGISYATKYTSESTLEIQDTTTYPADCGNDNRQFDDDCLSPMNPTVYGFPITYKTTTFSYGEKSYDESGAINGVMVQSEEDFREIRFALNSLVWAIIVFGLTYFCYIVFKRLTRNSDKLKSSKKKNKY